MSVPSESKIQQIRKDVLDTLGALTEDLTPEQQKELVETFSTPSKTLTQGGFHRDDFDLAVESTPRGYDMTKFEMSSDGYHWDATYELLEQLEKTGRLV